jgi:hypothetical protein
MPFDWVVAAGFVLATVGLLARDHTVTFIALGFAFGWAVGLFDKESKR